MNLLARLLQRQVALDAAQRVRLDAWRARSAPDRAMALDAGRFVVLDVESTGLDLTRDRLIAIGAVGVCAGRIQLADSFEAVLRQDEVSSRDNILIHGIGGEQQREGMPPAEALLDFLEFVGDSPLVAFHVTFDETMIRRAMRRFLGLRFDHVWLDLAYVMPGLLPEYVRRHRALDDWAGQFGIGNYARHNAIADALATAQLMLVAMGIARRRRIAAYSGLQELEKAQRWISWAS